MHVAILFADPSLERTVLCPLEENGSEVHLDCGKNAIIHVKHAMHGYQDIPQDTPACIYMVSTSTYALIIMHTISRFVRVQPKY